MKTGRGTIQDTFSTGEVSENGTLQRSPSLDRHQTNELSIRVKIDKTTHTMRVDASIQIADFVKIHAPHLSDYKLTKEYGLWSTVEKKFLDDEKLIVMYIELINNPKEIFEIKRKTPRKKTF